MLMTALWLPSFAGNITKQEAEQRALAVSDVRYALALYFEPGASTFQGEVEIRFTLASQSPLFIDFLGESVEEVSTGGKDLTGWTYRPGVGRILIPGDQLQPGENQLTVSFTSTYSNNGVGLHQFISPENYEYLYTDLQPDAAQRVFPCFDQPDMRARIKLTAFMDASWTISSNTPQIARYREGKWDKVQFDETPPIATYLFNVVAGQYAVIHNRESKIPMRLLCRQEMYLYVNPKVIFAQTEEAIEFFSDYFDIPYPFKKYDQCFVPQYNFGAMENPGSVTFNERYILGYGPSENDLLERQQVFLHEAAHMWFGNYVTMKWWEDLWLNESFASYMEILALRKMDNKSYWISAAKEKQFAYEADSIKSPKPILRNVPESDAARSSFDPITYRKGLAVLEQFEHFIGEQAFRDGIRKYLKEHAWQNTTRKDFFAAMAQTTGKDMDTWQQNWLETSGHNQVELTYRLRDGIISEARLHQYRGNGSRILRTHHLTLGFFGFDDKGDVVLENTYPIILDQAQVKLPQLNGVEAPLFILPNLKDRTFIDTRLDAHSLKFLRKNLHKVKDRAQRFHVLQAFRQLVSRGEMSLNEWFGLLLRQMETEQEMPFVHQIVNWLFEATNFALPGKQRDVFTGRIFEFSLAALNELETHAAMRPWLFFLLVEMAHQEMQQNILYELYTGQRELRTMEIGMYEKEKILISLQAHNHPQAAILFSERQKEAEDPQLTLEFKAATPSLAAKKLAWNIITDANVPLADRRVYMEHFFHPHTPQISAHFVNRYFAEIPRLAQQNGWEFLGAYAQDLFPFHGGKKTLKAGRLFLSKNNTPPLVRELIRNQMQVLEEAMRIRSHND